MLLGALGWEVNRRALERRQNNCRHSMRGRYMVVDEQCQSHSVLPQCCAATLKGSRSRMCSPSGSGCLSLGGDSERLWAWQSHSLPPQSYAATLKGSRSGMCPPRAVGCLRVGGDSEWRCVGARPLGVMDRIEAGGPWQSHSVLQQACAATLKGSKSLGFRV